MCIEKLPRQINFYGQSFRRWARINNFDLGFQKNNIGIGLKQLLQNYYLQVIDLFRMMKDSEMMFVHVWQ
jgi:hypothetical protein